MENIDIIRFIIFQIFQRYIYLIDYIRNIYSNINFNKFKSHDIFLKKEKLKKSFEIKSKIIDKKNYILNFQFKNVVSVSIWKIKFIEFLFLLTNKINISLENLEKSEYIDIKFFHRYPEVNQD